TRSDRDWSSDVCSSDLAVGQRQSNNVGHRLRQRIVMRRRGLSGARIHRRSVTEVPGEDRGGGVAGRDRPVERDIKAIDEALRIRSEERRVGKECMSLWG